MTFFKKYWIALLSIFVWCVITLVKVFHHIPWYDEAHAWNIAQGLNFVDILKLMHVEGHTFLWYLCLMPFAKLNIGYPYSMLLINWLFCFIAILILWFKSPFSTWLKFLITFSFPFLQYFPIIARCYSIGIMFLFIIAALENKKLKYPNWYAFLLVMLANTSVIALFGATILGMRFVFEMIKNKSKNCIPYIFLLIGVFLILFQLGVHVSLTKYAIYSFNRAYINGDSLQWFSAVFMRIYRTPFILISLNLSAFVLAIFYVKNKIIPWFLIFTISSLFLMYCLIYRGFFWHDLFVYIYFLASLWITIERFKNLKLKWIPIGILTIFSIVLVFARPSFETYQKLYNDSSNTIADFILASKDMKISQIVGAGYLPNTIGPYLRKENIDIKILCSGFSYNSFPKNWSFCGYVNPEYIFIDNFYSKNQETYLILYKPTLNSETPVRKYNRNLTKYYDLYLYADFQDASIYKVLGKN